MSNVYELLQLVEKAVRDEKDQAYQRGFEDGKKYVMKKLKEYLEENENEYAD